MSSANSTYVVPPFFTVCRAVSGTEWTWLLSSSSGFGEASVLNPCSIVWLLETLRNGSKLPVPELLCPVAPVKMAPLIESDRPGAVDRSTTVGVTRSSRHSTFGTVDGTRLNGAIRRRADREELERTLRARVRERSHAGEDMVISS